MSKISFLMNIFLKIVPGHVACSVDEKLKKKKKIKRKGSRKFHLFVVSECLVA